MSYRANRRGRVHPPATVAQVPPVGADGRPAGFWAALAEVGLIADQRSEDRIHAAAVAA